MQGTLRVSETQKAGVRVAEAATIIAPVEANSILKIEIEDALNVHE